MDMVLLHRVISIVFEKYGGSASLLSFPPHYVISIVFQTKGQKDNIPVTFEKYGGVAS